MLIINLLLTFATHSFIYSQAMTGNMLLFSIQSVFQSDYRVWIFAGPVIIAAIVLWIWQILQHRKLVAELAMMSKMKRHNIEYELVLKAMKLSTWRIDVPTRSVTFESDYRERSDNIIPSPGASVDSISACLMPEYEHRVKKSLDDIMSGRIEDLHEQYQMQVPHSDKSYWAESYATVDKRDIEGKPLTIVGTTMRIDGQKEIEQALITARNQAEESERLKTAFLANISHEIRTPLNAIVGFSDVLPMAQTDEERNELISLIKQNNAHLLRLFDDMVNMSKLEAGGNKSLNKTQFALMPLFAELVDKYKPACAEKNLVLTVDDNGGSDLSVVTDRDRLKEILNQYLNNAVKFTSQGSIKIGAEKTQKALRLYVSDTGKGIPADRCDERLFERFVKVDEFVPGTGLGLSICRSIATNLGGVVGVESTLSKGSTFWVDLPLN